MATTDHPTGTTPAASELAERLAEAPFVRIVAGASGDALAASGLVVAAVSARDVPFQVSVVRTRDDAASRLSAGEPDDVAVAIGCAPDTGIETNAISVPGIDDPASVTVAAASRELGIEPDPTAVLVGIVASGARPADYPTVYEAAGGEASRTAGVGLPTADLADGLAHTTLAQASFSGDELAAGAALADLADDDPRTVASLLVFETLGRDGTTPRSGTAIERALRPHATPEGTFASVEGYADVLDCVAKTRPGIALALAIGRDVRVEALEAWREHASAARETVRTASTSRYDGLFVAQADDAPVETTARLLRDFRSPEPVALVLADGEAGVAAVDGHDVGSITNEAATAVGGTAGAAAGNGRRGYARFECGTDEFLTAFREALA